jgi:ketosteroid isomerase-like protein
MSQENVESVRAAFEAWNAGDMDALREMHDPDVIARPPEGWPEPGPYMGREAVMRWFEQLRETWDVDALELISDFIDVGDRVAVRWIWRTAGYGPEANWK